MSSQSDSVLAPAEQDAPELGEPQRFRKRPVEIDAIRWTGQNWSQVCEFLDVPRNGHGDEEELRRRGGNSMPIVIHTLEGDMRAEIGNWILRGVKGEYYPCRSDIFELTYEPVVP